MVDCVVAGAGIAGIATAWQLAERLGSTDAVLVDPLPPLSATSNRPEANYRDWWPQPAMAALADLSLELVDGVRRGATVPMDRRGYLYVTSDGQREQSLREMVAARSGRAVPGERPAVLDGSAVRRAYPHLAPEIVAALRVPRAGGLDVVALGGALLARAAARGVSVIRGRVVGVDIDGDGVRRVDIESSEGLRRLDTRRFVNAAGPFGRPLLELVGASLPLETVLRQKVVLRDGDRVVPRDAPFTILLDGQTLPWTDAQRRELGRSDADPRVIGELPGGIHIKPDDTAGPDALKLGWAWDSTPMTPTLDPACPPEFPEMVLLGATRAIPGLQRYLGDPESLVAHEGGFYARLPDGQPAIGPVGPPGSFVVGGLAGFGAMMGCGAGAVGAAWLVDEPVTSLMRDLSPGRFEDASYLAALEAGGVATGEL